MDICSRVCVIQSRMEQCFVQDENVQARVVLCPCLVVLEVRVAVAWRRTSASPLESEKRVAEKSELLSVVGTLFNARL